MSKTDDRKKILELMVEWNRLNPDRVNEAMRMHEIEHRLMALKKSGKLKKLL